MRSDLILLYTPPKVERRGADLVALLPGEGRLSVEEDAEVSDWVLEGSSGKIRAV